MTLIPASFKVMAFATLVAYAPATARAQAASDLSGLSAEALFAEGRRLMAEGQTREACDKFRESERLDPAVGTLLNLARCEKTLGRTASAWLDYREAASRAHAAGEVKRERVAREEADALSGLLPHLHVNVPPSAQLDGLALTIDATVCPSSLWNSSLPLDPGTHTLTARAPGFEPWTTSVALAPAEEREAVVPALERRSEPPTSPAPGAAATPALTPLPERTTAASPVSRAHPLQPTAQRGSDPLKLTGFVVGGVGAALLVTGGGFALHAKRLDASSRENDHCDSATGFAVTGAVLLAAGVVLVVLPRHGGTSKAAHAGTLSLQAKLGSMSGLCGSW